MGTRFYGQNDFMDISGLFFLLSFLQLRFRWPRMFGRRTSGSSRPSLGVQAFPSFPRENRNSRDVWKKTWKSQTSFFQTSAGLLTDIADHHPSPIKSVHMAVKSGIVCHKTLCKSLCCAEGRGILTPYDLSFYGLCLGHLFC